MSSHDHAEDVRNTTVKVWMNGALVPRKDAVVSILDSGFLMGDGVWEGLRIHDSGVPFLDRHLDRLEENARALALDLQWSRNEIHAAIAETARANQMTDGVHARLMVTRGVKSTPFQGTGVNQGGPTRILLAEWKTPPPELFEQGLNLVTVPIRRGRPDVQDPAWNSHSKLNCVSASIAADRAAEAGWVRRARRAYELARSQFEGLDRTDEAEAVTAAVESTLPPG